MPFNAILAVHGLYLLSKSIRTSVDSLSCSSSSHTPSLQLYTFPSSRFPLLFLSFLVIFRPLLSPSSPASPTPHKSWHQLLVAPSSLRPAPHHGLLPFDSHTLPHSTRHYTHPQPTCSFPVGKPPSFLYKFHRQPRISLSSFACLLVRLSISSPNKLSALLHAPPLLSFHLRSQCSPHLCARSQHLLSTIKHRYHHCGTASTRRHLQHPARAVSLSRKPCPLTLPGRCCLEPPSRCRPLTFKYLQVRRASQSLLFAASYQLLASLYHRNPIGPLSPSFLRSLLALISLFSHSPRIALIYPSRPSSSSLSYLYRPHSSLSLFLFFPLSLFPSFPLSLFPSFPLSLFPSFPPSCSILLFFLSSLVSSSALWFLFLTFYIVCIRIPLDHCKLTTQHSTTALSITIHLACRLFISHSAHILPRDLHLPPCQTRPAASPCSIPSPLHQSKLLQACKPHAPPRTCRLT